MKIYDYNGKKNICGDRLREARVVRRLRQEDLAAQIQLKGINMERDSISRIEIGTRFVSDFELKIICRSAGRFSKLAFRYRRITAAGRSRRRFSFIGA